MVSELRARILLALGIPALAACPREPQPSHSEVLAPRPTASVATVDAATTIEDASVVDVAIEDVAPEVTVEAAPPKPKPKPTPKEPSSWSVSFPKANWKEKWCTMNVASCLKAADAKSIATSEAMADKQCPKDVSFPCACSPAHPKGCPMEGLPPMRCEASFLPTITAAERAKTDKSACCYLGEQTCVPPWVGRAFESIADDAKRSDWRAGVSRARRDLARAAAGEHAAVASFALASLALMAHGAPAELIADTHHAALDEIEHARLLYGLAGEDVGPGPLPITMKLPSLVDLVVETFRDACVQETIGAIVAAEDASDEEDPVVAAVLRRIAEDEARHAVLAYRTLAWAVGAAGDEGRAALQRELAALDDSDLVRTLIAPCARAICEPRAA